MKNTLPAVLFICALIGLTGVSTAKADTPESKTEYFSALCVVRDRIVVNETSVAIKNIHPDNRFITLVTDDGRKIITEGKCTFVERKAGDGISMGLREHGPFPKDGEQRYAIGH